MSCDGGGARFVDRLRRASLASLNTGRNRYERRNRNRRRARQTRVPLGR